MFKKTLPLIVLVSLFVSACGGGGGGGDSTSAASGTTTIDVFDGAAIGCSVTVNGVAATEVVDGAYSFDGTIDDGVIIRATGCTDSDTELLLPAMSGVAQPGGGVISPITTLIVESILASDPTATRFSPDVILAAVNQIISNLGLTGYDPIDPATANYVAAAKADTAGTGISATAMRVAMALSTLLKAAEVAAGATDASAAVTAIALALSSPASPIDLSSISAIEALINEAGTLTTPPVDAALVVASTAVAPSVAAIAGTTGSINVDAILATTAVAIILNTVDETSLVSVDLVAAVEDVIDINLPPQANSVTITDINAGSVVVGDRLRGSYTYADTDDDAEGTSAYRWLLDGSPISGATSLDYVIVSGDLNKAISFEVSPIAATGTLAGSAVTSSTKTVLLPNCVLDESLLDSCLLQ
jgi:hypothetical protein